jgi:hypothetical protein
LLLRLTHETTLKAYLIQITGPLIRILSERSLPPKLRVSLLTTLNILVERGGAALRPFVFQLQTTYMNALNDLHDRQVREEAIRGIPKLLTLGAKIDFLFKDLLRILQEMKTALATQETSTGSSSITSLTLLQPIIAFSDLLNVCCVSTAARDNNTPQHPFPFKPSYEILQAIRKALTPLLRENEEILRKSVATCFGYYALLVDNNELNDLVE